MSRPTDLDALAALATLRAWLAPEPPAPPAVAPPTAEASGLTTPAQLARALQVSVATVGRLAAEGMPGEVIGTRRRYDVATCRAWLAARGRRPTVARASDRVDVDSVLAGAGLRFVGGGR